MKKATLYFLAIVWYIMYPVYCFSQEISPVNWHFESNPATNHEVKLSIIANVEPGWHLYSQHLKEGGPIPTKITFQANDDYVVLGEVEEKGKKTQFYDEIYEMDITWYSGSIAFLQRIRLNTPTTTIRGNITYMTCNDQICVPDDTAFAIIVKLSKQNP